MDGMNGMINSLGSSQLLSEDQEVVRAKRKSYPSRINRDHKLEYLRYGKKKFKQSISPCLWVRGNPPPVMHVVLYYHLIRKKKMHMFLGMGPITLNNLYKKPEGIITPRGNYRSVPIGQ